MGLKVHYVRAMAIKLELSSKEVLDGAAEALAVLVFEAPLDKQRNFAAVDAAVDGALSRRAAEAEFTGTCGQALELAQLSEQPAKRVVVVGLGPKRGFSDAQLRIATAVATRAAISDKSLALSCPDQVKGVSLRAVGEGVGLGAYRFTKYLTGERLPKQSLESVSVHRKARVTASERKAADLGLRVADAVAIARDAVNEPPNELTPVALAAVAQRIAKSGKLKAKILDKAGIAKAGMKLHYAVGQGSANEPRFIHLQYVPKKPKKKVVFVGKGLTFDSGGLCIKPAAGMGEMKSDMGGAAAVLGLMAAVCETRPNVEVHAIVGAAENMPDGTAYRPGDIFGSLDGRTVEIINTDAEGRLVLADALTYARQLEPDLIVDAATLTGACVVALGKLYSAFYTGDEKLARQFATAAKAAGESFWRLPLAEELRETLNTDVADIKHTGERWGGSITAALFLREFVGQVPWIHCDVAAPVLFDRPRGMYPKGGTGHPVLTFLALVEALG
jgi:leucyl aminopeptidase